MRLRGDEEKESQYQNYVFHFSEHALPAVPDAVEAKVSICMYSQFHFRQPGSEQTKQELKNAFTQEDYHCVLMGYAFVHWLFQLLFLP